MDFQFLSDCAPNVAPQTMARILKVESAFRPHAIGYRITKKGVAYRLTNPPKNKPDAISMARWLLDNGYRFDAGAAQVNSQHFERFALTPETIFDSCTSVRVGGVILGEFYARALRKYPAGQPALLAAISAYQTGSFSGGFKTGYVGKVTAGGGGSSSSATKPRWSMHSPYAPGKSPEQATPEVKWFD